MSKVAIVEINEDIQESLNRAIRLLGNIDDLNTKERQVVIKPGIFDHNEKNHVALNLVKAIINSFNNAPQIFLVESDNYKGKGLERLQIYSNAFTHRVLPLNLSEETNTRKVMIADEENSLSHFLFKPSVFVSTHVLRRYEKGTILKNLLGLIPEREKTKFHEKLVTVLLDVYEAMGGIDLAVIDGSYVFSGRPADKGIKTELLLVARDAIALEAVAATLVGLDTENMLLLQEAMKRGLGEGNVNKIELLGIDMESAKERIRQRTQHAWTKS